MFKNFQVACIGVSEPSGGSDVAAVKTTAKRDGDDWVINGQKMWITNSLQADWMCMLANTSEMTPGWHITFFLGGGGLSCFSLGKCHFPELCFYEYVVVVVVAVVDAYTKVHRKDLLVAQVNC